MVAIIDHIPRIQLSDIKELIRRQTGTNQKLMQLITLNNIEYRITVSIESKDVVYNPQNEMFRLLGTKRSFSQNETFFFSHP